ncbi:MAG: ABC transporter ATP-binding protein [Gammaproteobacteria bacterium RIFCSPLOWO2_02_FULL_42_14]|nr:MAG: ABC transporter ATP-binding protein [Gammaproteobacteria bacterium RIFCSPHIGHO2_02_FULL_42_43]OGT29125.1 MAG: ABC transporter ATP-binding protein [Gammaproteobacteria bacterium RIFCSPHIGHO2_01_FULL_42_8]OGT50985.1 MAG: ABC transporter ATP-binding protein [Gammaproteobacteria bacterium RIFCSPHIGHO2_12_FULL_41_25]OGT63041.1 MAG: ABC transporter ATP-binding protein [Gammaproteobacteria bacterium RIFCSPLOWO2_02_FULL_42_14]OGT85666.1 MAG: ABC transporter ATP-binding protein [Gammaproteobacte
MEMALSENIIDVCHLKNYLGGRWIHDDVNFSVKRGEIIAIIGGSGCGKTTLLRSILRLMTPTSGEISVFNTNVLTASNDVLLAVQKRWGVMFQSGALFSSLNVLENILYVLHEYAIMPREMQIELAKLKITMVGLELDAAYKYPSELSGGMRKRAALARAIAFDPELIFLDEPTAGLDPKSAGDLDDLILHMRDNLGLTFVMVTHDLDTLWYVPDRVIFLGEGKVLADQPMDVLRKNPYPAIQSYFSGHRNKLG